MTTANDHRQAAAHARNMMEQAERQAAAHRAMAAAQDDEAESWAQTSAYHERQADRRS